MRILLSIGCDDYRHASKLRGAVKDATSIFSSLVGSEEHQYDPDRSKLLISPSAQTLRNELAKILYDNAGLTVFTLYFAGHAAVVDETLYLAPVDTMLDRIPATAIGFPDVLRTTAGARPKQANFVIDACNAAGLGFDIGSILKRTIVGNSDTMGISFVASAAAEQAAEETPAGGRFTREFARTLRGDTFIQSARPFLSLAEIAQQIQAGNAVIGQTISYWTLNLQGSNLFAKNPHFSGPAYVAESIVSRLQSQKVDAGLQTAEFKSALAKLIGGINERALARTLEKVFINIQPDQRASLIVGLAEGLAIELASASDPFLAPRAYTVLLGQLLGLCPSSARTGTANDLIGGYITATRRAVSQLDERMEVDRNALLISSFSDLYELPVRISDILGQCALLFFGQRNFSEKDSHLISSVVGKILRRYGNSVLAVTEDQATGYLLFLEMCRQRDWIEFSEEVTGRLYHDLHRNFARCGDYALDAEKRFQLLNERYRHSISITHNLYASPSDLTTVILSFCAMLSLDEAVDLSLIQIDHTSINYFVSDNAERLGLVSGLVGANYTVTLGRDFWRCIDLRRILRSDVFPRFDSSTATFSWEDRFCSFAAALALRNRLPWHVVRADKN